MILILYLSTLTISCYIVLQIAGIGAHCHKRDTLKATECEVSPSHPYFTSGLCQMRLLVRGDGCSYITVPGYCIPKLSSMRTTGRRKGAGGGRRGEERKETGGFVTCSVFRDHQL